MGIKNGVPPERKIKRIIKIYVYEYYAINIILLEPVKKSL